MKLLVVLCLAAGATPGTAGATPGAAGATPGAAGATPGTVVVLPPEGPAAGPALAWVGEAVADALPRALASLGVPVVERADRLSAQDALAIPPVPLSRATSIRIAEALDASRLVVGSYEENDGTLTLSLRLLDVKRGTLSSPLIASGPVQSLGEIIHGIAWDVALSGPTRPTKTREEFLALRRSVPFDAFKAYARGLGGDASTRAKQLAHALSLMPGYDEARLALGRLHLEARENAAACEALALVPAESPIARQARFLQGVALLGLGRYRDAAKLYAELTSSAATPAVLNNHALALLRLGAGSPVRASEVLRRGVEMSPDVSELPFNLGWSLLVEGEAEAAAFWMRGVTRKEPRDTHARVVLAWALRSAGRDDEADEAWRAVLAVAPSYAELRTTDLSRRFERVMSSERVLVLDEGGRSDAELAASHFARGSKLAEAGDLASALRELTQAAYLAPYSAPIHQALARVRRAGGESEQALNELRMSLWCRDEPPVRVQLASLLKDLGRIGEARAEAERVLKADPGNAEARRLAQPP